MPSSVPTFDDLMARCRTAVHLEMRDSYAVDYEKGLSPTGAPATGSTLRTVPRGGVPGSI